MEYFISSKEGQRTYGGSAHEFSEQLKKDPVNKDALIEETISHLGEAHASEVREILSEHDEAIRVFIYAIRPASS